MRRARLQLTALLCAVMALAVALVPAGASADGDPASDVLLGQDVFYPYSPAVSGALTAKLNAETAAAKKAGFPVKVALIGSAVDLGVVPGLFGKPQKYADFLVQEISFQGTQHLLVVMPAGLGTQGLPPAARTAVARLPKPAGTSSDALAQAAIAAVPAIAKAAGHPISGGGSGGGSGTAVVIVAVLAAVALAAAGGLIALRRRRTPA